MFHPRVANIVAYPLGVHLQNSNPFDARAGKQRQVAKSLSLMKNSILITALSDRALWYMSYTHDESPRF